MTKMINEEVKAMSHDPNMGMGMLKERPVEDLPMLQVLVKRMTGIIDLQQLTLSVIHDAERTTFGPMLDQVRSLNQKLPDPEAEGIAHRIDNLVREMDINSRKTNENLNGFLTKVVG
jgi:hypothetical protein